MPATMAGLLILCGCVAYRPEPLPAASRAMKRQAPDLEQLRIAAAELHHPLVQAVAIDVADGLSPDEAAVLAVLANPELIAVRDAHHEVAAQLVAAGLLPNPILSIEIDQPHGGGSEGTVAAYNAGLGIPLNTLLERAARVAEASGTLEAVDLAIAWQEWQTAQAARLATVRLVMLNRRLDLVRAEVGFESTTVQTLERAVAHGDATIEVLGGHRSALEALHRIDGALSRSEAATRSHLSLLLGLPPESRIATVFPAAPTAFPALAGNQELVQRAARARLDLRALELGYQAQEARVRQAVLTQFPSLSIGISAQRNETDIKFLGGFVTLGLPIFNRHRAGIALQEATRTRLGHEYEARIAAIRASVEHLAEDDRLLQQQADFAGRGIVSLSRIEAAERQGAANDYVDRLTWQGVRAQLLDLRLQQASLLQARLEARVALDTAIGGRATTPGNEASG